MRRTAAVHQASRHLRLRPVRALYDARAASTAGSSPPTPGATDAFFAFRCVATADSGATPDQASSVIDLTAPSTAPTAPTASTAATDTGDPVAAVLDPSTFRAPAAVPAVRPNTLAQYSVLSAAGRDVQQRLQDEVPSRVANWALGASPCPLPQRLSWGRVQPPPPKKKTSSI